MVPNYLGPLLQTWFSFNPCMDEVIWCPVKFGMKLHIHSQTSMVEVWEWICNFIPYSIMNIITYHHWHMYLRTLPLNHQRGELIEAEWCKYALLDKIIIGSDNGLSPIWCQATVWLNADSLLIKPLGKILSEISMKIQYFSCKTKKFQNVIWKSWIFCFSILSICITISVWF